MIYLYQQSGCKCTSWEGFSKLLYVDDDEQMPMIQKCTIADSTWHRKDVVKTTGDTGKNIGILTRLVFASLSDLCLETGLDRVDWSPWTARFAGHEEDTVFLGEEGVGRLASLASDVFDWQKIKISTMLLCPRLVWHKNKERKSYRCTVSKRARFVSAGIDPWSPTDRNHRLNPWYPFQQTWIG